MNQKPLVSIGMPVYNSEKYIAGAIKSLQQQTFEDLEIIIFDNASTDNTYSICKNLAKIDKRIKVFKNSVNLGAAENYNKSFFKAKGKYFKWAACDDFCAPTFIEKCIKVMQADEDIVLCYSLSIEIDENGNEIGRSDDNLDLLSQHPHERLKKFESNIGICNPVFGIIRRNSLNKTNLIGKYIGSDVPLLLELCLKGKFYKIDEHLFYRREHVRNIRRLNLKDRAKWFDSSYQGCHHRFPLTYLFYKKILSIHESQLSKFEKILCYPQLFWWVFRKWRAIGGKYKTIIIQWIRNLF
jgi:glycosyltransferase involved in cell wall biosynthesis